MAKKSEKVINTIRIIADILGSSVKIEKTLRSTCNSVSIFKTTIFIWMKFYFMCD